MKMRQIVRLALDLCCAFISTLVLFGIGLTVTKTNISI